MIRHNHTNKWIALILLLSGVALALSAFVLGILVSVAWVILGFPAGMLIGYFGLEFFLGEGTW